MEGNGRDAPASIERAVEKGVGPLELTLLDLVWEMGQANSRELFEATRERGLHYGQSTILTVLRRLGDRGLLHRGSKDGMYLYSPTVGREDLGRAMVDQIVRSLYRGDVRPIIEHLEGRKRAPR